MIYQMQLYYGALIGKKVIYSVAISFDDCTELLKKPIDAEPFKQEIAKQIEQDGFNPSDFIFDWVTKEQYENRVDSHITMSVKT